MRSTEPRMARCSMTGVPSPSSVMYDSLNLQAEASKSQQHRSVRTTTCNHWNCLMLSLASLALLCLLHGQAWLHMFLCCSRSITVATVSLYVTMCILQCTTSPGYHMAT